MLTITQAVERAIGASPIYGEAILQKIVNFSSLARKIKLSIEEFLLEPVSEGSITIALKRLAADLRKSRSPLGSAFPIRNIALRSGLTSLVYQNSPALEMIHHQILSKSRLNDTFIHFAQGSHESSFMLSESCLLPLQKLAASEKRVAEYRHLSSISVRMPPEAMQIPGVFAPFVQALAWQQISVIQIVSYFTEITFVVSDADADRAFSVINDLSKKSVPRYVRQSRSSSDRSH